jgi:hypothetical protein
VVVRPRRFEITEKAHGVRLTLAIVGELDLSTVPVLAVVSMRGLARVSRA